MPNSAVPSAFGGHCSADSLAAEKSEPTGSDSVDPHRLHGVDALLRGYRPIPYPDRPSQQAATVCATPQENYAALADYALAKYHQSFPKLVILGFLAGSYIGLGFSLCCLVGGQLSPELRHGQPGLFNFLYGIFGFPTGLTLCVVAGASLFTSECMYNTFAVCEGKYGLIGAVRSLVVAYLSNLAGSLFLVALMVGGDVYYGDRKNFVIELALKKTQLGFGTALIRGVLCNWLVCLAVWQGTMARDLTGKVVGIFLPLSAFVAMGFEHCVANMFLIPMSMALGSHISVGTFVGCNLVPVTLGNFLGGAVLVGCSYASTLGAPAKAITGTWDATKGVFASHANAALHCHGHFPHHNSGRGGASCKGAGDEMGTGHGKALHGPCPAGVAVSPATPMTECRVNVTDN